MPDTMVNFLALLGWSLDGETTIIPRDVLCEKFSLDRVTKKDAVFDETKLEWMNGQYIKAMDPAAWVELSKPWLAAAMIAGKAVEAGAAIVPAEDASEAETAEYSEEALADAYAQIDAHAAWFAKLYPLLAERETHLTDAAEKPALPVLGRKRGA